MCSLLWLICCGSTFTNDSDTVGHDLIRGKSPTSFVNIHVYFNMTADEKTNPFLETTHSWKLELCVTTYTSSMRKTAIALWLHRYLITLKYGQKMHNLLEDESGSESCNVIECSCTKNCQIKQVWRGHIASQKREKCFRETNFWKSENCMKIFLLYITDSIHTLNEIGALYIYIYIHTHTRLTALFPGLPG